MSTNYVSPDTTIEPELEQSTSSTNETIVRRRSDVNEVDNLIRRQRRRTSIESNQPLLGSTGMGARNLFPETTSGLGSLDGTSSHVQMAPLEPTDSRTRFNCSSFHLTYPSHVPFELIKSTILAKSNSTFEWYSMCHELGTDEVQYPHTHVAFKVKKKLNFYNPRFFDITHAEEDGSTNHVIHPNIARIEKTSHAVLLYWSYHRKNPVNIEQSDSNPGTAVLNVLIEYNMIPTATFHWSNIPYSICEYYDNIIHNIYHNSNNCSLTCIFLNKPLIN